MPYRAVLFDIGGVVVGSPLDAIARYERDEGIPPGSINRIVIGSGARGAWSRLERGELRLPDFFVAFDAECSDAGCRISAEKLMTLVAESIVPRPAMLEAIARIRARGLRTAAVTNNWITEDEGTGVLRPHFDAFIESSASGVRKPDPRIFELACDALGVTPPDAIMLDDIGMNLKTARTLGMATIKVSDPDVALAELESLLGFPVRG